MRCIFVLRLPNFWFGNIDFERAIGQGISIEHADGLVCFGLIGHGDKCKALREARDLVHDKLA